MNTNQTSKKRYTEEEKRFMLAGLRYAEAVRMPRTKLSWGLASLMNRPDSSVYQQLGSLQRDWDEEVEDYEEELQFAETLEKRVGDIVTATVISVTTFGALCSVENTTRTLLLHISEMANEYISDVGEYVWSGDVIQAMIIVGSNGRLALSTKRIGPLKRRSL